MVSKWLVKLPLSVHVGITRQGRPEAFFKKGDYFSRQLFGYQIQIALTLAFHLVCVCFCLSVLSWLYSTLIFFCTLGFLLFLLNCRGWHYQSSVKCRWIQTMSRDAHVSGLLRIWPHPNFGHKLTPLTCGLFLNLVPEVDSANNVL